MVWQFVDALKRVINSNKVQDDDFADRLNRRHTVGILMLFTILVGTSQYVGSPIACWTPAEFTGAMVQYTNYICWISNTYYVPIDQNLPNPNQTREHAINYYQWVPFILCLMALMFYLPFVLWHLLAQPNGLDAKSIMKIINSMDPASSESREKCMLNSVKLIDRAIEYQRINDLGILGMLRRKIARCCLPMHNSGYYISSLYMLIKLLYIFNVCGQFFLLNLFMGPNFNIYGFQVIQDAFNGKNFWESSRFPRVTLCDFMIRTLGENNNHHTIQCTLPINLFNEKIFIFIWFWLFIVATLSVYSLFPWLITFTSSSRIGFIKRYLKANSRLGYASHHQNLTSSDSIDEKILDAFLFEYLKFDGVFLLRLIKKNTNDLVVGELICALWDNFKRSQRFTVPKHREEQQPLYSAIKAPQSNNIQYGYPQLYDTSKLNSVS